MLEQRSVDWLLWRSMMASSARFKPFCSSQRHHNLRPTEVLPFTASKVGSKPGRRRSWHRVWAIESETSVLEDVTTVRHGRLKLCLLRNIDGSNFPSASCMFLLPAACFRIMTCLMLICSNTKCMQELFRSGNPGAACRAEAYEYTSQPKRSKWHDFQKFTWYM